MYSKFFKWGCGIVVYLDVLKDADRLVSASLLVLIYAILRVFGFDGLRVLCLVGLYWEKCFTWFSLGEVFS